jgi:hypothetical protein
LFVITEYNQKEEAHLLIQYLQQENNCRNKRYFLFLTRFNFSIGIGALSYLMVFIDTLIHSSGGSSGSLNGSARALTVILHHIS